MLLKIKPIAMEALFRRKGSENDDNNVIYWDYDPIKDKFQRNPTVLDVSSIARSVNNQLNLVSIRALPGAIMLAGRDGAYFLKYSAEEDTYTLKDVPGIKESMSDPNNEYSDFWCFNSGNNDGTMVFAILRKPNGNIGTVQLSFERLIPAYLTTSRSLTY